MREIAELFASQDSVATIEQLDRLGVGEGLRRRRIASREWVKLSRSVVGLAGVPMTWERTVRVAMMTTGADAAVSHATAARLHGLDGYARRPEVHITVCGIAHRTSSRGVRLHRSELLEERACVWIDGLRVVSKPVALLQIAGADGTDACAKALDGVLRDGAAPIWIEQVVRHWQRRGVRGPALTLALLHQRVNRTLPRSWFQRLARRVLVARGVQLVDEHPVEDPITGRVLAELDLAAPGLRIGVECQSWKWHASPGARAHDAARKRRLRLLGWELVELWWTDLGRIDDVVAELEYLIDQRRQSLLA